MPAMLQSRSEGAMIFRPIFSKLLRDRMFGLIQQRHVPSLQVSIRNHLLRNLLLAYPDLVPKTARDYHN